MATIVMPFGKHKGEPADHVPTDYLRWLLTLPTLKPSLRWAIVQEMESRTSLGSTCSLEDACHAYLDELAAGETWQTVFVVEYRRRGGPWREHSRWDDYEVAWDNALEDKAMAGADLRVRREETRTPPIEVLT